MFYATLKALHLLSIIFWVGGMAFAHFCLRPAVVALEPPIRLTLMHDILRRFFAVVSASIVIALLSGLGMMGIFSSSAAQSGVALKMPLAWMVMATLGIVMMLLFGHIRFVLFKRLQRAVHDSKWAAAAAALASIRVWVRANLAIGLVVVVVAAASGY
jgi:uncharacterized membrane protein